MNNSQNTIDTNFLLREKFDNSLNEINKLSVELINRNRSKSINDFVRVGIPQKSNEEYKFIDLNKVFSFDFKIDHIPKSVDLKLDDIFKCDVPNLNTRTLVLLNGRFVKDKTQNIELPDGVILGSLSEASLLYPEIVNKYIGKLAIQQNDGLVALNSAFVQDGIFIYVPKNSKIDKAIQIINIVYGDESIMVNDKNLFILEENSSANIVICDHSLSAQRFLSNTVSEVFVGRNSVIDYTRIQNEHNGSAHLSNNFIYQEKNSKANINTISLHGGVIRNNMYVKLDGEGSEHNNNGLALVDSSQHVDNYISVEHAKPHCTSYQNFKNIMDDESSGAFNGRILVQKGAVKTSAFQKNNNILLTDYARINSKPQLEIYDDDVKCTHGATSGQLDEDVLFYLRSRGIPVKEARLMLMTAFVSEIINKIRVKPLQNRIYNLVEKRLRGEFSRCNNCRIACQDIPWDKKLTLKNQI